MNISNLKKTYYYLKRNGIKRTISAVEEQLFHPYFKDYTYELPDSKLLEQQRRESEGKKLCFSIVVPAYETPEEYLRQLIQSLLDQSYPVWQLIIADAGKTSLVKNICEAYRDSRICYVKLEENLGISQNTNAALPYIKGEYAGLLDHDDYLTPDALYEMEKAISEGKKAGREYDFLYSDEDKCEETGRVFYQPHFKMDFNLDLLLSNNYICHFLVMKTPVLKELGLRQEYDGAQDYDLVLRMVHRLWKEGKVLEEEICHIPKVLYHWRCHQASTASNPASKSYAYEAGKRALEDFCSRRGWQVKVEALPHVGFYKVVYENGIFAQRADVAALGGKEVKKGKIVNSIYDKQGEALYGGMKASYSGYVHRAVLTQNAGQLDITKWKINPMILKKYETFFEAQASKEYTTEEKRSIFCEFLIKEGYRLYWDPDWRV